MCIQTSQIDFLCFHRSSRRESRFTSKRTAPSGGQSLRSPNASCNLPCKLSCSLYRAFQFAIFVETDQCCQRAPRVKTMRLVDFSNGLSNYSKTPLLYHHRITLKSHFTGISLFRHGSYGWGSTETENTVKFRTWSLDMHFSCLFTIDNFTFIVLNMIAPVVDLGMSFGKVKVWKRSQKSLESYIQNCVGALFSWISYGLFKYLGGVAIGNPERHMRKASHCGSKQQ